MTLIQSHTYTINLANVNYIRSHREANMTIFKMNNGRTVQITCPYDVVMSQLKGIMNTVDGINSVKKVINLEY